MKNSLSKKLGARIRELREAKKIKQVELAETLNMEPSNLSKLENGNQLPKEENIEKIAAALDVKICDLFDFEHKKDYGNLKADIYDILDTLSQSELEFTYKILINMKILK